MFGICHPWRKPLALLLLFLASLAVVVSTADAAPVVTGRWILDVRFDNGNILATRRNQVYEDGILVQQWDQPLPLTTCQPLGAVAVGVDRATFSGGAIRCNLPSFRLAVWQKTGIILASVGVISGPELDSWGQATIADLDFTASGRHPLVLHPDYATEFDVGGAATSAELQLGVAGMNTKSIPFLFPAGVDFLVASRLHDCNGVECAGRHYAGGPLGIELIPQGGPQSCTTDRTRVYLGSNGADSLYGELVWLRYDPGCIATQG